MEPITVLGVRFTALNLLVLALTTVALLAFAFLFSSTRMGWAMRATAQNARAAAIVGIRVPAVFSQTWMIAGGLAAVAGLLLAPLIIVTPDMGVIANKGFVAAILGGFSSLPGAVVGGLMLGLAENLIGVYVTSAYKDVLVFGLLILLLLFFPPACSAASWCSGCEQVASTSSASGRLPAGPTWQVVLTRRGHARLSTCAPHIHH